jgi:dipeptidyl aminopeptidase/acylaminoacyl peptidase
VIKNPALSSSERYETFPSWSPDGRYLYFCSAPYRNYRFYDQIRYDLLRVTFDDKTGSFGKVDTVVPAEKLGFSISFPRVSPDGKYLLYSKTAYGSFTIWHDDADLELLDLESGQTRKANINSNRADSYHTWSSSGRWVVFSSRREDGLYTRLYFSYFDEKGNFHKPFLLPQRNPNNNATLLKSYNVPELITSSIKLDPRKLARFVKSEASKVSFKKIE